MVVFSIAVSFMNRPSTATVVKPSLEDSVTQQDNAKTNTITAKNFSLEYDAAMDTVSNITQQDSTALEVYRVARSDTTGRRIFVITVKRLPPGGASEESSYKLRQINPNTYKQGSGNYGDNAFTTFEKTDGSELTAFSVNGGRLAMLSYSLQAPEGSLNEEVAELLNEFKWQ